MEINNSIIAFFKSAYGFVYKIKNYYKWLKVVSGVVFGERQEKILANGQATKFLEAVAYEDIAIDTTKQISKSTIMSAFSKSKTEPSRFVILAQVLTYQI